MNKTDFIKVVSEKTGTSVADVKKIIETSQDVIVDLLKEGDSLTLTGFGSFKVSTSKERNGHNPKTGEKIIIKSKQQPKFSFSTSVKDTLN